MDNSMNGNSFLEFSVLQTYNREGNGEYDKETITPPELKKMAADGHPWVFNKRLENNHTIGQGTLLI